VAVDADLGTARARRVVAVYDVGRIVNRRLARSQFIGGIVWEIALALEEDTHVDWRYGRITNANLADYHVPVNWILERSMYRRSIFRITPWIRWARAASAKSESRERALPSRMQSFIRRANAFATCRSRRTSWCEGYDLISLTGAQAWH
jgi:hypothetical protein